MVAFIDANRDELGVEPICTTLQFAPSTYYAAKTRPPSARAIRDAVLAVTVLTMWKANYSVYGARKMWKALSRAGETVGRDQVARIMRGVGIRGVQRGRRLRTTRPDDGAARPPDLVDRKFTATRPNVLWVTDLTFVPTWSGVTYVCFIVDAFSRTIVGWRVAGHMRTAMVLDALGMACFHRGTRLDGLVCHSDAGSQYTSLRYTERLDEIGARPSIGSVADSYDNALAEAVNGLYKSELIRPQSPWKTVDDVELATLAWVHWFIYEGALDVKVSPKASPCGLSRCAGSCRGARDRSGDLASASPGGVVPLQVVGLLVSRRCCGCRSSIRPAACRAGAWSSSACDRGGPNQHSTSPWWGSLTSTGALPATSLQCGHPAWARQRMCPSRSPK